MMIENHNALTLLGLWAPIFAIYIMDIRIWYALMSAHIGGLMGARSRLGEIRSLEMLHKRFKIFPKAFVKNLVSSQSRRTPQIGQYLQQLKLVMDAVIWAFRHTERNIAETGLGLLLEMLKNFQALVEEEEKTEFGM